MDSELVVISDELDTEPEEDLDTAPGMFISFFFFFNIGFGSKYNKT